MTKDKNDESNNITTKEVVLEVQVEGGLLSIHRFHAPDGPWRFDSTINESAMGDFLDKDDQTVLVRTDPSVATVEEALERLSRYQWYSMHIEKVHPEYERIIRPQVLKRLLSRRVEYAAGQGKLTAAAGDSIRQAVRGREFEVYYDHGEGDGRTVGKIVSSIEEKYKRRDELGQLDIAIVKRGRVEGDPSEAVALIEIEETNDKPKTILSDVFSVLTGEYVTLPNKVALKVSSKTTLIVMGNGKNHDNRNYHIHDQAMLAKFALRTGNSRIGNIVIDSYSDGEEFASKLAEHVEEAIRRYV